MRTDVRENSPERLVVVLRPVTTWGYWLFGVLFVALGVYVGNALGRATTVACVHGEGVCHVEQWRGTAWTRERIPITDVRGARVDTVRTSISASMLLVLATRAGDRPIDLVNADGDEKLALAARVEEFLDDPGADPLYIAEDNRVLGWAFALFLIAAGLVCILALEDVRVLADRASEGGTLRVAQRRWRRTRVRDVALSRIRNVEKRVYTIRHTRSCSVVLVLDGGAELSLTRMPLFTDASANEMVRLLSRWLELRD